ncbi:hypothetical protein [Kitasatospora sp. NPDC059827]|uniref:hypothetical protein n=1 Tax=Kitasatospora sp. NPDC059827 TaxID=3346964 RepID=UPI003655E516
MPLADVRTAPATPATPAVPASVTVTVAQPVCAAPGRPDTLAVNAERHAAAVREAGTRLVVFPELSLTGYDLTAPAADPAHAEETAALGIDAYVASTLYGPGPAQAERLAGHLRERTGAHAVWGVLSTSAGASGEFAETSGRSGVWAPDGTVVGQLGAEPGGLLRVEIPGARERLW